MSVIDLFSGARGWEAAADIDALGIEWDKDACATSEAAGFRTLCADVAELDPLDFGPIEGLIASAPCQPWSNTGKRGGKQDQEHVIACAHELAAGNDSRAGHLEQCSDPRSLLTVEPLRWALALKPRWIAFEQVPAVLPLWSLFAELLSVHGYETSLGLLTAEQYGVPQTRKRAFLIASLDGPVDLPAPTHQKYKKGEPAQHKDGLLPWVSMAEALGWPDDDRLRSNYSDGTTGERGFREAWAPAPTLTSKAGRMWHLRSGQSVAGVGRAERPTDCPALTVTSTASRWAFERPAYTIVCTRRSKDGIIVGRQLPPGEGENVGGWGWKRPATTVNCDPRISRPGRHDPAESGSQQRDAIRVTATQASILQGFPADYPWQGTKTKQFQQIGNAVCPPLGKRVLEAAMANTERQEQAA